VTRRSTDALIRELRGELTPVRRIPPLRLVAVAIAALAVPGWVWMLVRSGGPRPDFVALASTDPVFAAIGVGLAAFGIGGALAAAALAVPGRVRTARAALWLTAIGAVLAFAVGPLWLAAAGSSALHGPTAVDLRCLLRSLAVGWVSSLAGVAFGWWAAPRHLALTAALAAAAGAAIGALSVHLVCPAPDALHWLFGHAGAPVLAALSVLPIVAAIGRMRR